MLVVCCASALGRGAGGSSALLQQLWGGGLWASLDNSVPLKAAAREVDIGGSVVRTHLARRARPVPGQIDGGQFLSDTVRQDPHHLGIYGGMYWGQDTAPKPEARARGLVRQGDKWLRAPARGQRGAGGKASDAQVGGIIKALEQQKSPPPPEWWVRKREEWLQKQRVAAAKKALTKHLIRINPDFTGTPMDAKRDALYARGPALSGLRSIPSHKEQRGAHGRHAAPKRPPPGVCRERERVPRMGWWVGVGVAPRPGAAPPPLAPSARFPTRALHGCPAPLSSSKAVTWRPSWQARWWGSLW